MSKTSWLRNWRTDSKRAPAKRPGRSSRRRLLRLERLEDRRVLSATALSTPLEQPNAVTQAQVSAAYGQLPLSFEANQGQTDTQVNFLSRGSGYTLFLTPSEAVLSLAAGDMNDVVRMRIVGADPDAPSTGLKTQAGHTNYLIGDDPSQWHTEVANYGKVEYQNVYSGIDLVYYGNQRRLEYDFVVAPRADPNVIELAFDGVRSMELGRGGNLILHTAGGDLVKDAPVVYQEIDGSRHTIAGRYLLDDGQVRFEVGTYDHSLPLVIDPILSYSTYLGGKGIDHGYSIAVDATGNAYVTGDTNSINFPTKNPLQASNGGYGDVFVSKLNATGTALVYSTYLGGSNTDVGKSIAVDSSGNAYVAGYSVSTNFPTTPGALQTLIAGGTWDGFVAKLNDTGSGLVYSTYLGGSNQDKIYGVAVDTVGNAYVTGATQSTNFPTANALQATLSGGADGFVAELNAMGSALVYSTYCGGSANDIPNAIAVDGSGNAYVTGSTGSTNFPTTTGAFQLTPGGQNDAFITKLTAGGIGLAYSTYLGGSTTDVGYGIAVDSVGNAYVTGYTSSTNFPTTLGAFQATLSGGTGDTDAFVIKLSPTGSGLIYSTYLGGSTGADYGYGIAVDSSGNAYMTGETRSNNFPVKNALQSNYAGGGADAFVTQLSATGSGLVYSTYIGGSAGDTGYGIAVDSTGNAYVTGTTSSTNFPTKNALQSQYGGPKYTSDAFVAKISSGAALLATSSAPAMSERTTATPLTLPQVQPLLDEAIGRWLAVGVGTSALHAIDIRIADLGGTTLGLASGNTLGLASGNTVWLDDNAAGWGWFVDGTPQNDSEFLARGNQGERERMDLLTVVMHELGHLLGHEHEDTGVMSETLAAGTRHTPGDAAADWLFSHSAVEDYDWLSAVSTPSARRRAR